MCRELTKISVRCELACLIGEIRFRKKYRGFTKEGMQSIVASMTVAKLPSDPTGYDHNFLCQNAQLIGFLVYHHRRFSANMV